MSGSQAMNAEIRERVKGLALLNDEFKMLLILNHLGREEYLLLVTKGSTVLAFSCFSLRTTLETSETSAVFFSLLDSQLSGEVNVELNHSTHPDDENAGEYKWISPGDTKVRFVCESS